MGELYPLPPSISISQSNTYYVDKTAVNLYNSIQAALNAIPDDATGIHIIDIAAGTYNEKITFQSKNNNITLKLIGKKDGAGIPTVIIDCNGFANTPRGIQISGAGISFYCDDIQIKNAGYGFHLSYNMYNALNNCITVDCSYSGLYAMHTTLSIGSVIACKFTGIQQYGALAYHSFMSLINTEISGASVYGAYWSAGSQGHCDGVNTHDCLYGIAARHGSTPQVTSPITVENCSGAGVVCEIGSYIDCSDWSLSTFNGNLVDRLMVDKIGEKYYTWADNAGKLRISDSFPFSLTAGSLVSGSKKIGSFTRLSTDASGEQVITGVGFKPTAIIFLAVVGNSTGRMSAGFGSVGANLCIFDVFNTTANAWGVSSGTSIIIRQGNGSTVQYSGAITAISDDGFTVTWTKGAAAIDGETITVYYMALS